MKQRDFELKILELLNSDNKIGWTELVAKFKGIVSEENCNTWTNQMEEQEHITKINNQFEKAHGLQNRLEEIKEEIAFEQEKENREKIILANTIESLKLNKKYYCWTITNTIGVIVAAIIAIFTLLYMMCHS